MEHLYNMGLTKMTAGSNALGDYKKIITLNKFEKICNLTWEVYKRTDEITLQHIVSTIIEILYDGTNTIDTITRKLIIERL